MNATTVVAADGKPKLLDRVTILPKTIAKPPKKHLMDVKRLHEQAMQDGYGGVELPDALDQFSSGIRYRFEAGLFS